MIPAGNTNFHLLYRKCASTDVFRNGEKTEVCRFMGQRGKKIRREMAAFLNCKESATDMFFWRT